MHCPKCAQKVSEEVQFCPACGLRLDAVRQLIETDGRPSAAPVCGELTPRRESIWTGLKLILVALALWPATFIVEGLVPGRENTVVDEIPLFLFHMLILTLFLAGFAKILYGWLFQRGVIDDESEAGSTKLGAGARQRALPPEREIPVPDFSARRTNTGEIFAPPSATEHTTRSLGER